MKNLTLLVLFVSLPACAQLGKVAVSTAVTKPAANAVVQAQIERSLAERNLSQQNVSAVLQTRAQRTLAQALTLYETTGKTLYLEDYPAVSITNKWGIREENLYPDLPFLTSPENISDYIVSRNNRWLMMEMPRLKRWQTALDANYAAMRKEANKITQPERGQEEVWLARQIGKDVTDLYIGEEHDVASIQKHISKFITAVRNQQPDRQIFLFTEFLPEGTVWTENSRAKKLPASLRGEFYVATWDSAIKQNISVVGLEPEYAVKVSAKLKQVKSADSDGPDQEQDIWASYEGIRLRNQAWLRTIQQYRAQYPDALFIVYAGSAHVLYHQLFALPTLVKGGKPFVVAFTAQCNNLELFYPKIKFSQRVIAWDTPEFAKLAGYDAHILTR